MVLQGLQSMVCNGFWCFVWMDIISANLKNYMIGIVSQNRFLMICHTSNCCTMGGTNKYFRLFCFTWNVIPIDMPDYTVSNYIHLFCTSLFSHIFIIYIISANIILDCSLVVKVISVILAILSNPAIVFIPVTSVQIHKGLVCSRYYVPQIMHGRILT